MSQVRNYNEFPYQGIRTFLKAGTYPVDKGIKVIGVPLDSNTSFRSGARHGPAAIREASLMLTDGSHPVFKNNIDYNYIYDAGDFPVNNSSPHFTMEEFQRDCYISLCSNKDLKHLLLGGDHSLSYYMIKALSHALSKKISVVHFDAHCDTWKTAWGEKIAHGTWLYHAINDGYVDPVTSIQIGIRSPCDPETSEWFTKQCGTVINSRALMNNSLDWVINKISSTVDPESAYLTFDIDALDPAYAPGTGTPEIGGMTTQQAQYIIEDLNINWLAADFVEVCPAYDHANITALAAASLAYSWVCQQQSLFNLIK